MINYGDTVIIHITRDILETISVTPGATLHTRYGDFAHDGMVGLPLGSKYAGVKGRGFVHLLSLTPERWSSALRHRTQILYRPDMAFITMRLNVRGGSRVVEAGTGSGSFTHSLARTVGPAGRVYSYEYHRERFEAAQREFDGHGLANVTLAHRNVSTDGFDLPAAAHAVFLDLPAPWAVVPHAKAALDRTRLTRICCFSPCIEQVLKTVEALVDNGFYDVSMFETLERGVEVGQAQPRTVGDIVAELNGVGVRKEMRRQWQIQTARERNATSTATSAGAAAEENMSAATSAGASPSACAAADEDPSACAAADEDSSTGDNPSLSVPPPSGDNPPTGDSPSLSVPPPSRDNPSTEDMRPPAKRPRDSPLLPHAMHKSTKNGRQPAIHPGAYARGHTSYLTFATLPPAVHVGSLKTV